MQKIKLFEKIDNALENKKESEIYLIYIIIFLVIGTISYLYIYPFANRVLINSKNRENQIKAKIAKERSYILSKSINGNNELYIKNIEDRVKKFENKLHDTIYINRYIDTKLKKLSYLLYSDVNWANFLDNISKNAKKYNVVINFIKNKFNKLNYQKVEQALDIEVDADGDFKNLIKFINSIEKSKLVVDVYKIKMDVGKRALHVNFKIAVWGIRY